MAQKIEKKINIDVWICYTDNDIAIIKTLRIFQVNSNINVTLVANWMCFYRGPQILVILLACWLLDLNWMFRNKTQKLCFFKIFVMLIVILVAVLVFIPSRGEESVGDSTDLDQVKDHFNSFDKFYVLWPSNACKIFIELRVEWSVHFHNGPVW